MPHSLARRTDIPAMMVGITIDPHRTAVLALHWQVNVVKPEGFFGPPAQPRVRRRRSLGPSWLFDCGVVPRAARFHHTAATLGVALYYTRFVIPVDKGELVRNTDFMTAVAERQEAFRPGAPGAQLIPEMTTPGETVDNQKLSGLAGNDLAARLAERGVRTVLLTGVATNLTVEQTARHPTDLGFTTYTVRDCVAAASPELHEASPANLALATAGCRDADDLLAALR
jgi:nicotinamidase-related amidase